MFLAIQSFQRMLLILLLCVSFTTQAMAVSLMSCEGMDMNEMSMQTHAQMNTPLTKDKHKAMLHGEHQIKPLLMDNTHHIKETVNVNCNQCVCALAPCSVPVLMHQMNALEPVMLLLSRLPSITTPILSPVNVSLYKPPIV